MIIWITSDFIFRNFSCLLKYIGIRQPKFIYQISVCGC